MAIRTKTVLYAFDTRTTNLATNTTLGTATRHDFTKSGSALTVEIPETGSRTFLSVRAVCSFRTAFSLAGQEITGVRMGAKFGAGAFTDTDRSWTQADTGNQMFMEVDLDITSLFTASFGAGTSQTVQIGLAVSTDVAANIGGSICCHLEITYSYDDSVGTTRVKTIPIPIQSHHVTAPIAQTEIGTTGGTLDAPVNQIPALSTYLEESGISIKDAFFEMFSSQNAGTDTTPYIQIDATPEVAGGVIEADINAAMPVRCLFAYDTATHALGSAHALKFRTDVSSWALPGGVLWVTYTYNSSTSTRVMNWVEVPLTAYGGVDSGSIYSTTPTDNIEADRTERFAEFNITETGTITLKQSAAILLANVRSSAPGFLVKAGGQASYRTYTPPNSTGLLDVVHRGDHSSGWTIARGKNRLTVNMYNVASNRVSLHGKAYVVYSSDKPSEGTEVCSRVVSFLNASYIGGSISALIDVPGASQRTPVLDLNYTIHNATIDYRTHMSAGSVLATQLWIGVNSGESGGEHLRPIGPTANLTAPQISSEIFTSRGYFPVGQHFKSRASDPDIRYDINTSRRHVMRHGTTSVQASWCTRICLHSQTFTVAGAVTVNSVAVADGKSVEIYAVDSDDIVEKVATVTTTGGTGSFSATVPDNTRTYFASYKDGSNLGRSDNGAPGASFNITIGGAVVVGAPPTVTITSLPTIDEDPAVVSVYDDVGFTLIQLTVQDRTDGPKMIVYESGVGFYHPFNGRSSVSGSGTSVDPYIFRVYRRGRWPTGIEIDFKARAIDSSGNNGVA